MRNSRLILVEMKLEMTISMSSRFEASCMLVVGGGILLCYTKPLQ